MTQVGPVTIICCALVSFAIKNASIAISVNRNECCLIIVQPGFGNGIQLS